MPQPGNRGDSPKLHIAVQSRDGECRVTLGGELDIANAPRLRAELARSWQADAHTLIVDLAGVTFMDSIGLREILHADAQARDRGDRLVLIEGPRPVQRVFETTGMGPRLTFHEGARPDGPAA